MRLLRDYVVNNKVVLRVEVNIDEHGTKLDRAIERLVKKAMYDGGVAEAMGGVVQVSILGCKLCQPYRVVVANDNSTARKPLEYPLLLCDPSGE